jgi:hypothetical protein
MWSSASLPRHIPAEHGSQWFIGRVAPHTQREGPEALPVGGGDVLHFCVGADQGGVEIQQQRAPGHDLRHRFGRVVAIGQFGQQYGVAALVLDATNKASASRTTSPTTVIHSGHGMQIELLNRQRWRTKMELGLAMADYVEHLYDSDRRHSSLGYLTPIEFEDLHSTTTQPATLS